MKKKFVNSLNIKKLKDIPSIVLLVIAILIMGLIYSFLTPNFASFSNIFGVLQQSTGMFFIAGGQTLMLLLGGIDLSQGAAVGFISVITSMAVLRIGLIGGLLVGIIMGLLYGLIIGLLVTKGQIQPYIASIAMMYILDGATYLISRLPVMGLPTSFSLLGRGKILSIPINLILYLVGGVILYYFLRYSSTGRNLYAIGGNEEVARLSGIRVEHTKLMAWMINGGLVAFGSIILSSRVSSGQPTLGGSLQNEALGAVVIGGTLLSGGHGGIVQTFFGVLFISFLVNGLNLLGISAFLKQAIIGLMIIAVVWFSFKRSKAK